jgi:CubicO group peptidase (beta-lactamase class C family)
MIRSITFRQNRPTLRFLLISALLLLASCSAPDPAELDSIPQPVRESIDAAVARGHRVGVVIGFVNPRGRHFHASGVAEAGGTTTFEADSLVGIGSLTKLFTAELLAAAVVEGELQLETRVAELLQTEDSADTRLWQLATHRADLPRELSLDVLAANDRQALVSSLARARSAPSAPEYSNVGYALLGEALAAASQSSLADLVERRLAQPLGLEATGYEPAPERRASPHHGRTQVAPSAVPEIARGAGGLYSNAEDLLSFIEHMLSPRSQPLRARVSLLTGVDLPDSLAAEGVEALGWKRHVQGELEVFHHGGDGNGYQAFVAFRPATRTGVVLLANSSSDDALQQVALHLMDPNLPLPSFDHAPALLLSREQLTPRVGRYRIVGDVNTIELRLDDDGLRYIETDSAGEQVRDSRLFALAPDRFELREIPVTLRFDGAGEATMTAGGQVFVLERR